MSQIFDSIKGFITPDLIQSASSFLGEDNSKVSSAISSMVPGLLGSLLQKGNSPDIESILTSAGGQGTDMQSQIANIFSGQASSQVQNTGNSFLTSLLGNKLGDFTSEISKESGLSQGSTGKLLSMVAPLIISFLGSKLSSGGGLNLTSLLGSLGSEKGSFASLIPSGLAGLLGGSSGGGIIDKLKGLFS